VCVCVCVCVCVLEVARHGGSEELLGSVSMIRCEFFLIALVGLDM
jgi:hypothetical protein